MRGLILPVVVTLTASAALVGLRAQNSALHPAPANAPYADDYPTDRAGVFVRSSSWKPIANQNPAKMKAAHGIAASLSYGLVPAKVVSEYEGEQASTQVDSDQPTICICHFTSIPGQPVLVRLHVKKGFRELDGGRMIVYPVVGGSKMADANKTDLIPVDVTQPDSQIWLIRPQTPLPPGEYALMLGTQNMSIFPFSVAAPAATAGDAKPGR